MNVPTPDSPEVTLVESATAAATDLAELAAALPGDRHRTAQVADKISEEVAELAAMIRALPGRPVAMSGSDHQILAGLAAAHSNGEDIGETVARALARLSWELGGSEHVTSNRPGSWEAAIIADLLERTTGPGPDDHYRTTQ